MDGRRRRVALAIFVAVAMVAMATLSLSPFFGRETSPDASKWGEAGETRGRDGRHGRSTTDDLLEGATDALSEQFDADMSWVLGEGMSRKVVEEDVPAAAEQVLRTHQSSGACALVQSGYLDFVGDVWSCTVQGEGWVEVTVVRARTEGGSEVTTIHMDAHAWERELLPTEGGGE